MFLVANIYGGYGWGYSERNLGNDTVPQLLRRVRLDWLALNDNMTSFVRSVKVQDNILHRMKGWLGLQILAVG